MKNRILVVCLLLAVCIGVLSGCGNTDHKEEGKDKLSVVSTIYPQYDWVKEIIGEEADNYKLTLLLDNGVDLHNYQPTAEDIATISNCVVFLYVGGESDGWVDDVLKDAANPNLKAVNLMEVLGDSVKEEEVVEGMQEESHDHEEDALEKDTHEEDGHDHDHEEAEYDEHIWLSLNNAVVLGEHIAQVLEEVDSLHADTYAANWTAYKEKLVELNAAYMDVVSNAARKTVLFGDRFPFRYLTEDYGLTYYAAFVGCSAETEASFETIAYLANKVEELNLPVVLTIEGSNEKIAKAIIDNTTKKDQKILTMNSIQSVTNDEIKKGENYLSVMKENLNVLKQALS